MRTLSLLALALLLAPTTQALLDDPEGDVQVIAAGQPSSAPDGRYEAFDLLNLTIAETVEALSFIFTVGDLDHSDDVPVLENVDLVATFMRGTTEYQLRVAFNVHLMTLTGDDPNAFANLERWEAGSQFPSHDERFDAWFDVESSSIGVDVPRDRLRDHLGATPLPGAKLADLWVESTARIAGPPGILAEDLWEAAQITAVDRMPDAGTATFEVVGGGGEVRGLSLAARASSRLTNGEATTLLFEPEITNLDDEPHTVRFTSAGVPKGWDVWFPGEGMHLEPGERQVVPVLVRIPFAHAHGEVVDLDVRAQSHGDPSTYGTTQLSVVFTDIPQPAGHHDRLWLHAQRAYWFQLTFQGVPVQAEDNAVGYLNTVEEHGEDLPILARVGQRGQYEPTWLLPLSPALGIGLDMDTTSTGEAEVIVRSDRILRTTTMQGRALHVSPAGLETVLGTFEDNGSPVDLAPDTQHTFELTFTPSGVERIAYQPDAQLWLELWLAQPDEVDQTVSLFTPMEHLLVGTWFQLPLDEYHDDVSEAFASLQQVRLLSDAQERFANPGAVAVFDIEVINSGMEAARFDLSLDGLNEEWAELPLSRVSVPAGQSAMAQLVVRVPATAQDEEMADIVVQAVRTDDPAVRALLRLVVRVDEDAVHPDQAADVLEAESQDASLPLLSVPVAMLAAGALRRRF